MLFLSAASQRGATTFSRGRSSAPRSVSPTRACWPIWSEPTSAASKTTGSSAECSTRPSWRCPRARLPRAQPPQGQARREVQGRRAALHGREHRLLRRRRRRRTPVRTLGALIAQVTSALPPSRCVTPPALRRPDAAPRPARRRDRSPRAARTERGGSLPWGAPKSAPEIRHGREDRMNSRVSALDLRCQPDAQAGQNR